VIASAGEADPSHPARLFERDLRKALDCNDLQVHYQPIFAVPSRRLVGAEALVRWRHPDHGLISAGDFLSTAVRSGLVSPITDWVLETSCRQAASWSIRAESLAVAVNLNDSQLLRRDLLDTVAGVLARSRLDPRRLQLEIAEHTLVERPSKRTADTIDGLREIGARVTLDGFGSSHGAMLSLRRLRLDLLKVDRALVGGLPDDPGARAIVGSALAGAVELELETSAGGVENDRQLDWLIRHGCQMAQGFLLGPACCADDFALRFLT
jgi:EAL domain-containing protein (putative c-di-GMP-specific phosphodiesterase class I)